MAVIFPKVLDAHSRAVNIRYDFHVFFSCRNVAFALLVFNLTSAPDVLVRL